MRESSIELAIAVPTLSPSNFTENSYSQGEMHAANANEGLDVKKGTVNSSIDSKQPNGTTPNDAGPMYEYVTTQRPKTIPIPNISYPSNAMRFLRKIGSSHNPSTIEESPTQAKVLLNIIIVGGGLGGLATSIALARRGHSVTILEQAHQLGEVRILIRIQVNARTDMGHSGWSWHTNSFEFKSFA
jgi:hypothetical protein